MSSNYGVSCFAITKPGTKKSIVLLLLMVSFLFSSFRTRIPLLRTVDGKRPDLHIHGAPGHDRLRVLRRPLDRQGRHPLAGGGQQLRAGSRAAQRRNETDPGLQVSAGASNQMAFGNNKKAETEDHSPTELEREGAQFQHGRVRHRRDQRVRRLRLGALLARADLPGAVKNGNERPLFFFCSKNRKL